MYVYRERGDWENICIYICIYLPKLSAQDTTQSQFLSGI